MLRIHHLNCVCACPLGGRLMDGRSPSILQRGALACHCLLVETDAGLVLVDTGYGLRDVQDPRSRLSRVFLAMMSPDFREEMTAVRQVERLGFAATEVRHIVLTHLDFDHAGGLDDFPNARIHLMERESGDATAQRSWLDRQRYRPAQWSSRPRWRTYRPEQGESWRGFDCVRALDGLPPELLLVPLSGHTHGHAGIVLDGADGGRCLLHAGDAYFHRREMDVDHPWCTPGLRFYQTLMEKDRRSRLHNQSRLRDLKRREGDTIDLLCAHDPVEFERVAGRPMSVPAGARQSVP